MKIEELKIGMTVMIRNPWRHMDLKTGMIGYIKSVRMIEKADGTSQPVILVRVPFHESPVARHGLYDFHPEHLFVHPSYTTLGIK